MANTGFIIQTKDLTKHYGRGGKVNRALEGLTLNVQRGEIFGYLGPNGAGKSTTIRMLLDLIRPTRGSATVLGLDPQKDSTAIRQRVGFIPGELVLWNNERGIDIVRYFGRVRGGVDMPYVDALIDRLQLDLSKRMREYSTGNKRKLGLVLALMNRPELLILDEPTSGLDPLMQQTFNQLMIEARQQGQTVFLSSHLLSEVQAICDRVGILRHGELKAVERVEALTTVDFRWVTLKTPNPPEMASRLRGLAGMSDLTVNGSTLTLRLHGDFDPLLRAVGDQYVVDLHVKEPTLEEIFLTFYEDQPSVSGNHHNHHPATTASAPMAETVKERVK